MTLSKPQQSPNIPKKEGFEMAKSKVVSMEEAMTHVRSGMTVMIPGFVNCGVPETLIKAVIAAGYTDFNLISNIK